MTQSHEINGAEFGKEANMTSAFFNTSAAPLSSHVARLERDPRLINDPDFANELDMAMTNAEEAGASDDLYRAEHLLARIENGELSAP